MSKKTKDFSGYTVVEDSEREEYDVSKLNSKTIEHT